MQLLCSVTSYCGRSLVHTGVIVGDNLLLADVIERLRRKKLKTVDILCMTNFIRLYPPGRKITNKYNYVN